jgi:uncharacterized RDD family membrane protein YckC
MRCPKCHYISFDSGERCRNCGYEFSLVADSPDADLPVEFPPEGPLTDFSLNHPGATPDGQPAGGAPAGTNFGAATAAGGLELPLFQIDAADDRPLVTPPRAPRAPLAVRRATPTVPRGRERSVAEPPVKLQLESDAGARDMALAGGAAEPAAAVGGGAEAGRRLTAGLLDLAILGGIDVAVLYFTLQLAALRWSELGLLPLVPFVAFLVLLDGGYLVGFTAAVGQTIGKMAAGIRVVPLDGPVEGRPSLRQVAVRTAAYLVSAAPLGLGFLPALAGERRALHDRLAGTRVVRVS